MESYVPYLKWRDNEEGLEYPSTEPGEQPGAIAKLAGLRVLESGLKHRIRPHPKRVLEGEVRSEWGQALPESPHAFRAHNRGTAVYDALVGPGPVELQPGLDDIDGLQTRGLHDSSKRAGYGFNVWWDRFLGIRIGDLFC